MKEDSGVSSAQSWGCPHAPQEIFKETQASKLGDAPVHPLLHQQSSVRPSPHYICITSCIMCFAWSVDGTKVVLIAGYPKWKVGCRWKQISLGKDTNVCLRRTPRDIRRW